jgi:hypothetical protein
VSAKQEPHPPGECPTCDTERHAAKGDVEALLREADACSAHVPQSLMARLAAALRAERERAEHNKREAIVMIDIQREACGHLRAVLAFMWPGDTGGPTVVQKARAFLAGEEHAPRPEDDATWLRRMWDEEVAAHTKTYEADLAKMHEIGRLKSQLAGERGNVSRLEAKLATEDEAHAHTRAQLAEVERDRDEWKKVARANAQDMHKALAAQNRAESEVTALRADLQFARQQRERLEIAIEGVMRLVEENAKGRV